MEAVMSEDNKSTATAGPFTDEEIESAARAAVMGMGRDFDSLKSGQKIGFVDEAKEILHGRNVSEGFSELVPGATPAVQLQFKTLVLQEFRNSPKWDEKEFKAGYGSAAASGGEESGAGSEATR
jgi:hypothetical protein